MKRSSKGKFDTSSLVKAAVLAAISIILTRVLSIMVPLGGLPALRLGFGSMPIMISGMLFGPVIGALTGIVADLIGVALNSMGGSFFPGFTLSAATTGIISGVLFHTIKIHKSKWNFNIANVITTMIFLLGVIVVMITSGLIQFIDGKPEYQDPRTLFLMLLIFLLAFSLILVPLFLEKNVHKNSVFYGYDKIGFAVTLDYIIVSLVMNTKWLSMMFDQGILIFLPGRIIAAVVSIPIYTFLIFTLSRLMHFEQHATVK
jgi:ECF transporter S component (folate family)